jgi:L-ascorbate metabolism protein UlaG (beta-lactamase superfamily)
MTARDAIELCRLVRPRTVIPIHYEGWKHFRQGRDAIERDFARAPEDVRRRIRWLPIGVAVQISALDQAEHRERSSTGEPACGDSVKAL